MSVTKKKNIKKLCQATLGLSLLFAMGALLAAPGGGGTQTIGTVASSITATFTSIGNLITAASYIAGLAFSIGAVMKAKQYKETPTQIQIGQVFVLFFVGASLLFLPSVLSITGGTMFGSGGTTAGPGGTTFTTGG